MLYICIISTLSQPYKNLLQAKLKLERTDKCKLKEEKEINNYFNNY